MLFSVVEYNIPCEYTAGYPTPASGPPEWTQYLQVGEYTKFNLPAPTLTKGVDLFSLKSAQE